MKQDKNNIQSNIQLQVKTIKTNLLSYRHGLSKQNLTCQSSIYCLFLEVIYISTPFWYISTGGEFHNTRTTRQTYVKKKIDLNWIIKIVFFFLLKHPKQLNNTLIERLKYFCNKSLFKCTLKLEIEPNFFCIQKKWSNLEKRWIFGHICS